MSRLIHLNGPPGIGKSTLARRYVADHRGVLNCDVDVLRTLIGGWQSDFQAAGALIRPAALAMIRAYLDNGHDVVLPQMMLDSDGRWGHPANAAHTASRNTFRSPRKTTGAVSGVACRLIATTAERRPSSEAAKNWVYPPMLPVCP